MSNQSFWINHNWRNENLKCHFCGNTQSEKYKVKVVIVDTVPNGENAEKEVCICNKCVLLMDKVMNACSKKGNEIGGSSNS